jgi:chloride channel protein, CIC family
LRIAGLIGMAAMFAGASRALLASIVFAFETTLQPFAMLPLAAGCTTAYLVSSLLMKDTIMTEKITRRGINVPADYAADFLSRIFVREVASYKVVSLQADQTLGEARAWLAQDGPQAAHHGFPVVDKENLLIGLVSRRELTDPSKPESKRVRDIVRGPVVVVFEDNTVRDASDLMVREGLGRLPVVKRESPRKVVAMISGSDVRSGNRQRLEEAAQLEQTIRWR